jgi:hypothetical protein
MSLEKIASFVMGVEQLFDLSSQYGIVTAGLINVVNAQLIRVAGKCVGED